MTRPDKRWRHRLNRTEFEVVAESIPHIVWLADAGGSTDYFNQLGTAYTGFPRQANYGWRWLELVHPEDADRARLGWEEATRTATPYQLSYRIRRNDGQFRWHAFRALPVRGPNGGIVRWIGTADDLDELTLPRDDTARIERQTTELRALLEAVQPVASERFGFVDPQRRAARLNADRSAADAKSAPTPREVAAASADGGPDTAGVSPRDFAVLRLVAAGYRNSEIANLLGLSLRSIEASRARLRRRLGLRTRAELVRFARQRGLEGPES